MKAMTVAYDVFIYGDYVCIVGYYTTYFGDLDCYLRWYNFDGECVRWKNWGDEYTDVARGVYVYEDYVYVVGYKNVTGKGFNLFLAKFDFNTGAQEWIVDWGGPKDEHGEKLFVYKDHIYIVGYVGIPGDYVMLIMKYDFDGNKIWNKTWGKWRH